MGMVIAQYTKSAEQRFTTKAVVAFLNFLHLTKAKTDIKLPVVPNMENSMQHIAPNHKMPGGYVSCNIVLSFCNFSVTLG